MVSLRPSVWLLASLLILTGACADPPAGADTTLPDAMLSEGQGDARAADGSDEPDAADAADAASLDAPWIPRPEAGPLGTDARTPPVHPAVPVSFVLRNESGRRIYIQDGRFWAFSRGGETLRTARNCEICACNSACEVCGFVPDSVTAIEPGAEHRWVWDGRLWERQPSGASFMNGPCDQGSGAPPGAATVTVSYGFSVTSTQRLFVGRPEPIVDQPRSISRTIEHPPAGTVTFVVD
jgi:hypothetical protein